MSNHLARGFSSSCRSLMIPFSLAVDNCKHDYQLEIVGGVYLTGAYVCRKCSYRIGMSSKEFSEHANYPGHYQGHGSSEPTLEERASTAKAHYIERLHEQLSELTSEHLPCELSQEEHHE